MRVAVSQWLPNCQPSAQPHMINCCTSEDLSSRHLAHGHAFLRPPCTCRNVDPSTSQLAAASCGHPSKPGLLIASSRQLLFKVSRATPPAPALEHKGSAPPEDAFTSLRVWLLCRQALPLQAVVPVRCCWSTACQDGPRDCKS